MKYLKSRDDKHETGEASRPIYFCGENNQHSLLRLISEDDAAGRFEWWGENQILTCGKAMKHGLSHSLQCKHHAGQGGSSSTTGSCGQIWRTAMQSVYRVASSSRSAVEPGFITESLSRVTPLRVSRDNVFGGLVWSLVWSLVRFRWKQTSNLCFKSVSELGIGERHNGSRKGWLEKKNNQRN